MKGDVIIIGAGPAGGAAALRLAGTGLKTTILEKNLLPRQKACGGAVSPDISNILMTNIASLIEDKIHRVRYLNNFEHQKIITYEEKPCFLMVDRSRFDQHLINQACQAGRGHIVLRDGFRVRSVEEDNRGVTIRGAKGENLRADFVIAADGALGVTAGCLRIAVETRCFGWAIDARVEVTPEIFENTKGTATFNFFCIHRGYGWIFPKDGYLSCGIMSWQGNMSFKLLDNFLKESFPDSAVLSVRRWTHPIPLYRGHRTVATHRICLAGDAAHLVDPIMGEGIGRAVKSGDIAATVIAGLMGIEDSAKHIPGAYSDCRLYKQRVEKEIIHDLDAIYRLIYPIFTQAPEVFYSKFIKKKRNYRIVARSIAKSLVQS